jgi:anaerobic selenocysteine-containing dehydrogenase
MKKTIGNICKSCHDRYGVLVTAEGDKITKIEENLESLTKGTMWIKGRASIDDVYNPNRVLFLLKRRGRLYCGYHDWCGVYPSYFHCPIEPPTFHEC